MKHSSIEVKLLNTMGTDLTVVNAARVSFHKTSHWQDGVLSERDSKLIHYLARHKHWTPFGHISAQFLIKAPIFVARQLVKHQVGLVWNEVSRRYVDEEPEFYFPEKWRGKPENKKQGSTGYLDAEQPTCNLDSLSTYATNYSLTAYITMLNAGVAPEQARMLLPQNTMTEWWWSGSVAAFARVCHQRLDEHAQEETREVAQHINRILSSTFPVSWKALMENK